MENEEIRMTMAKIIITTAIMKMIMRIKIGNRIKILKS